MAAAGPRIDGSVRSDRNVRIALIADVHANLPALEAVLTHARSHGARRFWNAGDYVGYGAFPEQTVRRLRSEEELATVGNYDLKVLRAPRKIDGWRRRKHPFKAEAFLWAHEQLSAGSRAYLASLPRHSHTEVAGVRVILTHASLDSVAEHLGHGTSEERWSELAAMVAESGGADLVLSGHSHRPFDRSGRPRFYNPGSVGRPEDGDPRANYSLLEFAAGEVAILPYRVLYDTVRAVTAMRQAGLPEAFAQMVLRGLSLDAVLAAEG
jgi:putative phosphoesterase